jgi:hypothetical protein
MNAYKIIATFMLAVFNSLNTSAQSFEAKRKFMFYVTVSRGDSKYVVRYPYTPTYPFGSISFSSWRPAVGFFISPQLAIEYTWSKHSRTDRQTATGTTMNGRPAMEELLSTNDAWAIPLTARYNLLRGKQRRFNVDVLAGLSFVNSRATSRFTRIEDGQVVNGYYVEAEGSGFHGMVGLAGRYAVGQHFELVGDFGFNRPLRKVEPEYYRLIIGNPSGLTRNRSIGLRYRFNLRKPRKVAGSS